MEAIKPFEVILDFKQLYSVPYETVHKNSVKVFKSGNDFSVPKFSPASLRRDPVHSLLSWLDTLYTSSDWSEADNFQY